MILPLALASSTDLMWRARAWCLLPGHFWVCFGFNGKRRFAQSTDARQKLVRCVEAFLVTCLDVWLAVAQNCCSKHTNVRSDQDTTGASGVSVLQRFIACRAWGLRRVHCPLFRAGQQAAAGGKSKSHNPWPAQEFKEGGLELEGCVGICWWDWFEASLGFGLGIEVCAGFRHQTCESLG